MPIAPSELILNEDGSIYHLGLLPGQLTSTVITVGDPERVEKVSRYFDAIDARIHRREFVTHVGRIGDHKLMVLSTGIGTDNVDIVLNELDALANIDFSTREISTEKRSLDIIRIGTSGAIDNSIAIDSVILSKGAIGLDGLLHFYERDISDTEDQLLSWDISWPIRPYYSPGSGKLLRRFESLGDQGITITNTGFYGPQSRSLRLKPRIAHFFEQLESRTISGYRMTNLEMETAGLYGLAELLGHHCVSINAILANRRLGLFSKDPGSIVERTIESALDLITRGSGL